MLVRRIRSLIGGLRLTSPPLILLSVNDGEMGKTRQRNDLYGLEKIVFPSLAFFDTQKCQRNVSRNRLVGVGDLVIGRTLRPVSGREGAALVRGFLPHRLHHLRRRAGRVAAAAQGRRAVREHLHAGERFPCFVCHLRHRLRHLHAGRDRTEGSQEGGGLYIP